MDKKFYYVGEDKDKFIKTTKNKGGCAVLDTANEIIDYSAHRKTSIHQKENIVPRQGKQQSTQGTQ